MRDWPGRLGCRVVYVATVVAGVGTLIILASLAITAGRGDIASPTVITLGWAGVPVVAVLLVASLVIRSLRRTVNHHP